MNHLRRQLTWNSPLLHLLLMALAVVCGLALARLSLLNASLLIFFSLVGITTLVEPLVGLLVTLFLGVLWAWLRAEVPAIPALIAMPVLALTLAAWLMRGAARREIHLPTPFLLFPLLLFIAAAAFSLLDAVELAVYGLPELLKWLQILALFWLVVDRVDARRLPWVLGGLLLIGLFQAGVGLWQFGLRGTGPDHFALNDRFYRAYGTFEQPNPYAGFLGLILPLGIGVLGNYLLELWRRQPAPKLYRLSWQAFAMLAIVTGLIGAAVLASWSRGAWLGAGAAMLAMIVALPRRLWLGLLLVTLLVVSVLGLDVVGILPASVLARLTDFTQYARIEDVRGVGINDANFAVIERLAHWQAALGMWRANFWNGVGFGDYEPAYADYRLLNWPIALGHAHNYYLNVAAETGLIGLVAYLFLWAAVLVQTWRVLRRAEGWWRGLGIGLLGAWMHFTVHHLFDNLYVNNVHLYLGVMLGLVPVLDRCIRSLETARSDLAGWEP
jgi:O-antigen ligase